MSAFLDAAFAKVTAGRSPVPRVYKSNAVPKSPGYPYSVLDVTNDQALNYLLDATHGTRDHIISVQSFGKTADAAHAYDEAADAALLDQRLTVAGYDCGPIRFRVSSGTRDPDDNGVVGVTSAYIFTTTKEQA